VIVVDSSALVAVLAGAPDSGQLVARFSGEELHAPVLIDYEVLSTARQMALDGRLDDERASDLLLDLDDAPIVRWQPSNALRRRAFELRQTIGAHDASYVALAEALECPLVTRDAHLAGSHGHEAAIELH
jgi:predicted nucleic acid-binding protein